MVVKYYWTFSSEDLSKLVNASFIRCELQADIMNTSRNCFVSVKKGQFLYFPWKASHLIHGSKEWMQQLLKGIPFNVSKGGIRYSYDPETYTLSILDEPARLNNKALLMETSIRMRNLYSFYLQGVLSMRPQLTAFYREKLKGLNSSSAEGATTSSQSALKSAEFWYFRKPENKGGIRTVAR
jgi:hypothetical protein